jgi:hypothetical protein
MAFLINSGAVAVAILALTVVEFLALVLLRRLSISCLTTGDVLPNILAGDFLLLAWLTNLRHAPWEATAAALLGALLSHVTDLGRRWRRA